MSSNMHRAALQDRRWRSEGGGLEAAEQFTSSPSISFKEIYR